MKNPVELTRNKIMEGKDVRASILEGAKYSNFLAAFKAAGEAVHKGDVEEVKKAQERLQNTWAELPDSYIDDEDTYHYDKMMNSLAAVIRKAA